MVHILTVYSLPSRSAGKDENYKTQYKILNKIASQRLHTHKKIS